MLRLVLNKLKDGLITLNKANVQFQRNLTVFFILNICKRACICQFVKIYLEMFYIKCIKQVFMAFRLVGYH